MAKYRFYFLDDSERIKSADDFACDDDRSALERARGMCEGVHVDVWNGARRVGRVNRGERPLSGSNRVTS